MNDRDELMSEVEIIQSGDAAVWTDQFVARFGDKWSEPDGELWGLMVGWFANAIETGKRIGGEKSQSDER